MQVHPGHTLTLPLHATFEHALRVLSGDAALDGQPLEDKILVLRGNHTFRSKCLEPKRGPAAADWRHRHPPRRF